MVRRVVRQNGLILILGWSASLVLIAGTILYRLHEETIQQAVLEARNYTQIDLHYRRWAATLGGLYASADAVPPNPYLRSPDHAYVTGGGLRLTLVTPSYMTRMILKSLDENPQILMMNRLVNLSPVNPMNAPDEWEREGLEAFSRGAVKERFQETMIGGKPYVRFIAPLIAEKSCFTCHFQKGHEDWKRGGGISITVPLDRYLATETSRQKTILGGFLFLFVIGNGGITLFARRRFAHDRELRESEERFRSLLGSLPDIAVQGYRMDGTVTYWNKGSENIYGYSADEAMGRNLLDLIIPPDLRDEIRSAVKYMSETGNPVPASELSLIHKDGSLLPLFSSHALIKPSGREMELFCIDIDLRERKRAEAALAQIRAELEERVVERTRQMAKVVEALQEEIAERKKAEEALQNETEKRLQTIEELRKKDQLLMLQGRQAAMGEMISNIAHQWRQPLNTLGLVIQDIQLQSELGQAHKEYIDEMVGRGMRMIQHMSRTIDDFRNFFKPNKEKREFDPADVIATTISLLEAPFRNQGIDIRFEAAGSGRIYGYPNEFSQVLVNIMTNARDVLVERHTEKAMILARVTVEGSRTVVTVGDNAGGVPQDYMERIFDPYFTTKGPDQGTGLGLFMAQTIIEKNMNGRLSVKNGRDGAEFRIEM